MMRRAILATSAGLVLGLCSACGGGMPDEQEGPDGSLPEASPTEDVPDGADGGARLDADGEFDAEAEPPPDDGGTPDETDGGGHGDEVPDAASATCIEPCAECTYGVDTCCGYNICQDDWSGVDHCMPVVPPHSGSCPETVPEEGTACPEPGLLCRYGGEARCKCGCEGWNCPY